MASFQPEHACFLEKPLGFFVADPSCCELLRKGDTIKAMTYRKAQRERERKRNDKVGKTCTPGEMKVLAPTSPETRPNGSVGADVRAVRLNHVSI